MEKLRDNRKKYITDTRRKNNARLYFFSDEFIWKMMCSTYYVEVIKSQLIEMFPGIKAFSIDFMHVTVIPNTSSASGGTTTSVKTVQDITQANFIGISNFFNLLEE